MTRVTYLIEEFCDLTGLSETAVARSMKDGTLRTVRIGHRRLVLAHQPRMPHSAVGKYPTQARPHDRPLSKDEHN
ncbi:hypothetical protein [Bradyrhizobium sp.]|uniref:hypothetical protein n=1 Tax=Bradyrhizobium sp. TaxID=376 RepID=UPI0025C1A4C1|nr:hypothetical protein [Bradyrhizobium sp.]